MLEDIVAVINLSPTTQECIHCLMKLIIEENQKENENRGSYELYNTHCNILEQAFFSEEQKTGWENYKMFLEQEASFFDPHKAYVAGSDAKLNGEMKKDIAYQRYIEKIKQDKEYLNTKDLQNTIFNELLESLPLDSLRDKLYAVDQLYKKLYAPFEKNLWIFFNLGYDCCPA